MSSAPARLLFLRPDTYGDLFLFEPVLRLAREALPKTKIAVLIREPYLDVVPLIGGEGVRWLTTACDPYREGPRESRSALQRLRKTVRAFAPDCVVAACYDRTWLEAAVASFAPKARQISLGDRGFDPLTRASLDTQFDIDWGSLYPEKIIVEGESFEWEKNLRLADALKLRLGGSQTRSISELDAARSMAQIAKNLRLEYSSIPNGRNGNKPKHASQKAGREIPRWWPMIHVPDDARERASAIFSEAGVDGEAIAVCCPAGTANVKIKSWPAERYGQTLAWLERERGIRCLLIGHESEKETLDTVQRVARSEGADPTLWLGRTGEMPIVAGLVERAQFYFGNDTGTLHLAAALGRPAVSIFGGGHWPRFKPLARRSAVVVQPLPCFGCAWNCLFGYAPCVKEIPRRAVISALEWLLAADANAETETVVEDAIPIAGRRLIAQTVAAHNGNRTSESPLGQSIQHSELVALLQKLDLSESDRAARLKVIEKQGGEVAKLQGEVDLWLGRSGKLQEQADRLAGERDRLAGEIEELRRHFATSESDRAARLEVIERQGGQIDQLQAEVQHWLKEAAELWPRLTAAESDRNLLVGEVEEIFAAPWLAEMGDLWPRLEAADAARAQLSADLEELRGHFTASEADRAARLEVIESQGAEMGRLHAEVDRWLNQNGELRGQVEQLEAARDLLRSELDDLSGQFGASEVDRAARLKVIEQQGEEITRLNGEVDRWLKEAGDLWPKLEDLRGQLAASEADRAARLEVIERQGEEINRLQGEVDRWLKEARELWPKLGVAEAARDRLAGEVEELRGHFAASEADRAARLEVIEQQGEEIGRLQGLVDHWLKEAEAFGAKLNLGESARNLLELQLSDLRRDFAANERDRVAQLEALRRQTAEHTLLRAEIQNWSQKAGELSLKLNAADQARAFLEKEVEDVRGELIRSESDRAARLEVIERQGEENTRLQAEVNHWLKEVEALWPKLNAAEHTNHLLTAELKDSRKQVEAREAEVTAQAGVIGGQTDEISRLRTDIEWYARQIIQLQDRQKQMERHGIGRLLKKLHLWPG